MWLGDIAGAKVGDKLYKTSSAGLLEELKKYIKPCNSVKKVYDINIDILEGKNITAKVKMENGNVLEILSNIIPEKSVTKPLDKIMVEKAFSKTHEEAFEFNVNCNISSNVYVSMASLNELRRQVFSKIYEYILGLFKRNIKDIYEMPKLNKLCATQDKKKALYVYNFKKDAEYISRYEKKYNSKLDLIYLNFKDVLKYEEYIFSNLESTDVYIVLSNLNLKNTASLINRHLERLVKRGIKGIVIGDIGYLTFCKELKQKYNIKLIADYTLNAMNSFSAEFLKENLIDRIAVNIETTGKQIDEISKICEVELVEDLCTAMTSRYCIIGSFVNKDKDICSKPCIYGNYTLVDGFGKAYNILSDNTDCVMRLVRNKPKFDENLKDKYTVRHSML